ncbi:MAG: CheB methylesterase domain-containing protein [Bdellovibrionota bacterium]
MPVIPPPPSAPIPFKKREFPVRAPGAFYEGPFVVIGASAGGIEALSEILPALPENFPPTLIVQHILPGFTAGFAERLNQRSAVRVVEARGALPLKAGEVILAKGGEHLQVTRWIGKLLAVSHLGKPLHRHMPAIDVLFRSAVRAAGSRVIGVLLTGMGSDGAEGMKEIVRAGGFTIAQDEATSAVYGMPAEAVRRGGASAVLPLNRIAPALLARLQGERMAANF